MADRPIIFSGPMVKALLDGRKTQTRRLATSPLRKCEPGDRLWVRENFRHWQGSASRKTAVYQADGEWIDHGSGWRGKPDGITWVTPVTPSIHMPRWASRLALIVEAVRFQHLSDIIRDDILAEGCPIDTSYRDTTGDGSNPYMAATGPGQWESVTLWYHRLWDELHGRGSWEQNPEIVALTFRVERENIDRLANA